jgi:hypothetical protein
MSSVYPFENRIIYRFLGNKNALKSSQEINYLIAKTELFHLPVFRIFLYNVPLINNQINEIMNMNS